MQTLPMKSDLSQLSKYNVVCQCGHHIALYSKAFHGRIAHNGANVAVSWAIWKTKLSKYMNEEQKFRDWLRRTYGVQDYEAYRNTQTEEIAIQYAKHFTAQLQQHSVSGKRLDNELVTEMRIGLDKLNDCYVKLSAACASGAVDTVAAGGDEQDCICPNYECLLGKPNRCAKPARKSSEGQP